MTKKIKDLAVKVGTYQKGGETKNRYVNIGAVFQKDDGGEFIMINRTFNPAGVPNPDNKDSIIISSFDVKDSSGGNHKGFTPQGDVAATPQPAALDDEIPF